MRVLLAEDEKRMAAAIVAPIKRMVCPPHAGEAARHRQFEIYPHFSSNKSALTQTPFSIRRLLFMQLDEYITKYAKIAYLCGDVQFTNIPKIAYFRFYLGLFSFAYHHAQARS